MQTSNLSPLFVRRDILINLPNSTHFPIRWAIWIWFKWHSMMKRILWWNFHVIKDNHFLFCYLAKSYYYLRKRISGENSRYTYFAKKLRKLAKTKPHLHKVYMLRNKFKVVAEVLLTKRYTGVWQQLFVDIFQQSIISIASCKAIKFEIILFIAQHSKESAWTSV